MNWIIHGLDRKSGLPRLVNVSADTETDAIRAASGEGVVTEHIEPILADAPRVVGGWSIFRDGTARVRYIVTLIWACRVGGVSLVLVGLWCVKKLFFDADELFIEPGFGWIYWAITAAMIGVGAAVVLAAEMTGEVMQARNRAARGAK